MDLNLQTDSKDARQWCQSRPRMGWMGPRACVNYCLYGLDVGVGVDAGA